MRRWWLTFFIMFLWIPSALAQDNHTQYSHYTTVRGDTVNSLAVTHNVCPEDILQANGINQPYHFYHDLPFEVGVILHIPESVAPCFAEYIVEKDSRILDVLQANNVCLNDYLAFNDDYPIHNPIPEEEGRTIHLRLDVPPCYEDGQRRIFFRNDELLPEPVTIAAQRYRANGDSFLWEIAWENNWCWIDVAPVNHPYIYGRQLQTGDIYYVPDDARRCDVVFPEGVSLVDLSFQYNVCIETLKEFNPYISSTWTLITQENGVEQLGMHVINREFTIPRDHRPCYTAEGLRVGFDDKAVHRTEIGEWLHSIAQQYDVCVGDLQESNPMLFPSIGYRYYNYRLPAVIFIPDVPSCTARMGDTLVHTMREGETYSELFFLYNICPNRFIAANRELVEDVQDSYETSDYIEDYYTQQFYLLNEPTAGDTVTILLDRPPCYEVRSTGSYPPIMNNYTKQKHVCYAQEVNFDADYSNHETVVSPVPYFSDAVVECHTFGDNYGRVIINNETIWYARVGNITAAMVVECLGILPEAVTSVDWFIQEDYIPSGRYWIVSNPPQTCPLLTGNAQESSEWRRVFNQQMMEVAGNINDEGFYIVAPYDTLRSIGRKYGYLPSMLASANNLNSPDMLFIYQAIKLPSYPSLYAMAKVAAGLLSITIFVGLIQLRMRRNRGKSKKKNS